MEGCRDTPSLHLTARRLRVAYGALVALSCDELALRGNTVAVIGHNGAGKSTFIKTLLGLLTPKTGEIAVSLEYGGRRDRLVPEQDMAFCPEGGAVFSDISVESYIRFWCLVKMDDDRYYRRGGSAIIEMLDVAPLLKKLGRELSKGQARRVQTAIGFLTEPDLFLFDEPFDGLDVLRTNELAGIITNKADEMCFIVSSHRMDVVERIADTVIILKDGAILASGSTEEVCRTLCNSTFVISGVEDHDRLFSGLQARFPEKLVNKLGNAVCLSGKELHGDQVRRVLAELGLEPARVEETRPSLVEAMNYHLKEVRQSARRK